jgi:site-specific DNA-adenine methylase
MRYGLPYKGSKNKIAKLVVDKLPEAETFVDLFFGGGAITHRAMLTGKYKNFIINDIDARLPKFFKDCIKGEYTVENHSEWISRDKFNANKENDAYIALIWSFGNNGKDYIYGKNIEDMKRAYHKAIYEDDIETLKPYGYTLSKSDKNSVYERYLDYQKQIKQRLQVVKRLQSLQSLQSLQNLQSYGIDYQEVPIPDNALIYCDIPYVNTNCGKYNNFNHERFYEWAEKQYNIFISEYWMPDNFIEIARIEKIVLSTAHGNNNRAIEKIFTNKSTYDILGNIRKGE